MRRVDPSGRAIPALSDAFRIVGTPPRSRNILSEIAGQVGLANRLNGIGKEGDRGILLFGERLLVLENGGEVGISPLSGDGIVGQHEDFGLGWIEVPPAVLKARLKFLDESRGHFLWQFLLAVSGVDALASEGIAVKKARLTFRRLRR